MKDLCVIIDSVEADVNVTSIAFAPSLKHNLKLSFGYIMPKNVHSFVTARLQRLLL